MSLVCALTNEIPEVPVISPVSGSVFERRLIEKFLQDNGNKDPVNGVELTKEMLIDVKVPSFVKAKPPTYASIPGILKSLQDEWDAVMLQCFTLRQQLQTARQELSHAMYQHDAACRVIARLTKANASLREALSTLKPYNNESNTGGVQPQDGSAPTHEEPRVIGISDRVVQILNDTATVLTADRKRKGKTIPENLTPPEQIKGFTVTATHAGLHSASEPGIMCLDVEGDTVVTGGNDKTVAVFSISKKQIVGIMKGHTKKVMKVVCHPNQTTALSGSVDSTVRIWNIGKAQASHVLRFHDEAITGLSLHATGDYVLASSFDRYWTFSDLRSGAVMSKVLGDELNALTSAKFHPDGLLCATGTMGCAVKVWDLKTSENVANFAGHTAPVTSIAFSENGYYLATAGEDSMVKLWDLRKLKNFKTIELGGDFNIADLDFDKSGTYLAVNGTELRVYNTKSWNEIAEFSEQSKSGTGVRFGPNASFLATTSMDRMLKFFGTASE